MKPSPGDANLMALAHEAFTALDGSLDATQRSWLEQLPLACGIDAVDSQPVGAPVTFVAPAVHAVIERATTLGGEAWLDRYLRLLLLALLIRALTRPIDYALPPSVEGPLKAERLRIAERANAADAEFYKLGGAFVRDWGFCVGTVLPFGICTGHVGASVPRDLLERGGLAHLRETPWLNLHMDLRGDRGRYTAEERESLGPATADFLRDNPSYQGLFSVGWLPDPAVSDITPHHAATRQDMADSGAVMLRLDTADERTARLATATSKTRRRLYQEGRYTPTEYLVIVARDDVLRVNEEALRHRAPPE